MTDQPGQSLDTSRLSPGILRILAGGMNLHAELKDIDILGPGGRDLAAAYCAAGQLQLVNRYSNNALYELTEEGRRVLAAYRTAYETAIGDVRHYGAHYEVDQPRASAATALTCPTCSTEAGAPVEWPCPPTVAYWPDLELPRVYHKVAELIEVYELYSPDDTGLYRRLQVQLGEAAGADLHTAACAYIEQERATTEARATLFERLIDAQHAMDDAKVAGLALAQSDPDFEGATAERVDQHLAVARYLVGELTEAVEERFR